ncbi:MAG: PfkB family carbohydrate kinase [Eubacteriales bacterium]|nr:PfkB family carbohydrate kinase [Eubacteriales bacterium]
MNKKILLINDFSGYGKVAVSAMTPVLVHRGFELFSLPTMIVSNTLNYGKFATIDTTSYMKEAVLVWNELGFKFDAVSTGFIANDEQAEFIAGLCRSESEKGVKIFVDPIMADNGKLYNSVSMHRVEIMKELASVADYIVPNQTEACLLSGLSYKESGYELSEINEMLHAIHKLGAKSVIITGAFIKSENGEIKKAVACYDHLNDECFTVFFDEIPVKVNGTGDTFSAIMIAELMCGSSLKDAVTKATESVRELIVRNLDIIGEYNGLPIEKDLDIL